MTTTDRFETRIDLANDKLLTLQRQAAAALNLDTQPIFVAALGDLSTALEELHVVAEELSERNAELLAARSDLEAESQHYEDLFEFAPDGYLVTSAVGVIEEANRAGAELLGVAANFLAGKPLLVFVAEADRPVIYTALAQLTCSPNPLHWEMTLQSRHGKAHQVAIKAVASRDTQGGVSHLRWLIHDITGYKQLEAALRDSNAALERQVADRTRALVTANDQLAAANARLQELDHLKDQFISRISHELRTPLTSIKIYLEMLDRVSPEKRGYYMQVLTDQTNRLQDLIENLLDVSEHNVNLTGLHLVPTDLNHLVASSAATAALRAATRGLTLTATLTPDLPLVAADAILLSQALSNLTTNALNYTPAGGAIKLSTALVTDDAQTWLTVTVRDTGPGIALDEQAHIFERFYRGRAAADYTVAGAGVGLSISRDILAALDGRLTVQSDGVPGHGATFTAWLKVVA